MAYPQVRIAPSAAKRIRNFDCAIFRDELVEPPALPNGEVVELIDRDGAFVASAFLSARSHIAARVISRDSTERVDRALFADRLRTSIARRAALTGTNAKRLVFAEADGLPGLIVDQYHDVLVLQSRVAGLEPWKTTVVDLLQELIRPDGILERSDKEFREEEGLPALTQVLAGRVPEQVQIEEHGLRFWVDPHRGQKTGFYLDQRDTRWRVRQLIQPGERVADVFAYTGAFGIGAAAQGARVVSVEREPDCLELAKTNAALNAVADRMEFVEGDAFYWLEAAAARGERFDWVLLDPPSLAKTKAEVLKGRQALHHLLVQALGLLNAGGTLALSLCTYHLLELAEEILRIAAAERRMPLRVRELSLQAPDHPWMLQMPTTRYLVSWLVLREA